MDQCRHPVQSPRMKRHSAAQVFLPSAMQKPAPLVPPASAGTSLLGLCQQRPQGSKFEEGVNLAQLRLFPRPLNAVRCEHHAIRGIGETPRTSTPDVSSCPRTPRSSPAPLSEAVTSPLTIPQRTRSANHPPSQPGAPSGILATSVYRTKANRATRATTASTY